MFEDLPDIVTLRDIEKFVKRLTDISVNVYTLSDCDMPTPTPAQDVDSQPTTSAVDPTHSQTSEQDFEDDPIRQRHPPAVQEVLSSTPKHDPPQNLEDSLPDSPIFRRKRKENRDRDPPTCDIPQQPRKRIFYFDESVSQEEEEPVTIAQETPIANPPTTRPSKPIGKCPFIHHEAEMSDEDYESSDEEDDSNCSISTDSDSDQSHDSMNFHRALDNQLHAQHNSSINQLDLSNSDIENLLMDQTSLELPQSPEPSPEHSDDELDLYLQIEDDIRYEDVEEWDDEDDQQPSKTKKKPRAGYIYPLRVEKVEKARHINLLLTECDGVKHYSAIINFSRLCRSQVSKCKKKMHFCYSCLTGFTAANKDETREECKRLQEHKELCQQHRAQRVIYPTKDKDDSTKFENIRKQHPAPFRIYADFEAALIEKFIGDVSIGIHNVEEFEKYLHENCPKCLSEKGIAEWKKEQRKATMYQEHKPISYKYIIVSDVDGYRKEKIYKGENPAEHMLDELTKDIREIYDTYIKKPKKMIWDDAAKVKFECATKCHICEEEFEDPTPCIDGQCSSKKPDTRCKTCKKNKCDEKVGDHDHFSGKSNNIIYFLII